MSSECLRWVQTRSHADPGVASAPERQTLAEQLAEIAEPAPVELDPEDGYAGYSTERNTEKRDLEAARAEYVDVGCVVSLARSAAHRS